MMQVIDESIRCSVITPYAGRFEHEDAVLDGYHIPKNVRLNQIVFILRSIHDKSQPDSELAKTYMCIITLM